MTDELTRDVAGGRDAFFDNPESDRLLSMMMRFMADHWALRERVQTLEALLTEHKLLPEDAVEQYTPSEAEDAARDMESFRFIQAVVDAGKNIRR